jgi:hypothetical protein
MAADVFEKFAQSHDPQGRLDWTVTFDLNDGEEISTATVVVVDPVTGAVDADTDLVLESVAWGVISGTQHGVTVWVTGGTAGARYYLRFRIETDATPISRKADKTMRLQCRQA